VLAIGSAHNRTRTALLSDQANTDPLTGLASRRRLSECIDKALSDLVHLGTNYFLILLDIDGFKSINDTYGHSVGDEALAAIAPRVQACARAGDAVARLGGDEFAVLVEGGDLSVAVELGGQLLAAVAEPISVSAGWLALTASGGIVQLNRAMSASDALRDVDVSMYEAKSSGKARLAVFEPHMQERVAKRERLGGELRRALERNEFEVYYQPTVHVGTGRVVGVEALVRWHHPERGLLLPGEFICAAEESGVIVDLGRWVLDQACHQARQWQPDDPGRQLTIAVNLSARQLLETDLVQEVEEILAASGLPGSALSLEITESMLLGNVPIVVERLAGLRKLGARIAIDDFGTGYSSLAYLRKFPIDCLKIDRSFVAGLGEDRQATALLGAIVAIAEALDLDAVAEGVEILAQLEVLSDMGCQVMQGYYFARPASASMTGEYLSDRSRRVFTRS
jgi:diguanylate cyclase (GGDEF)-like protein